MCIVLTWPVLLKAQQVIGCSIASDVLSLVRASLSQNENRPSDPTVASVPVIARKKSSNYLDLQVDFRYCFIRSEEYPECIWFVFWEKLRLGNFVSRLTDL